VAAREWEVPRDRLFVVYNGFEERTFARAERRRPLRDPYRLVYFSHPSKGLAAAIGILRRLRQVDPRFELHVYGGPRLWGGAEARGEAVEGMDDHGLIGQRPLAVELMRSGFSMNLQTRREPFGMTVVEAMRAGCVVVASPVGAYPEIIRDGVDGFLIAGDPDSEAAQQAAAERIVSLAADASAMDSMRRRAQATPWDTDTLARVWTAHWASLLDSSRRPVNAAPGPCPRCGGDRLSLVDGYHCLRCSFYSKRAAEAVR